MKKIISIFLMMFLATNVFAGKIKVNSGNVKFIKDEGSAVVEFDFSRTTWEGKEDFKTWCADQYEKRISAMRQSFITSFNEESKGLKISDTETTPRYRMIVVVEDLERSQSFTGAWGQGKFSTTCSISVIDVATELSVCEIYVDGFGSGQDFDYTDGLGKCFKGLAKELSKLK